MVVMKDIIILVVFKQIEYVLYFTFFFSFLYCCNFKFIEICKYSTSTLYPGLSVVNLLSYLLYQSHSRSLSLCPSPYTNVWICVYIHIYYAYICVYIYYIHVYIERERDGEEEDISLYSFSVWIS